MHQRIKTDIVTVERPSWRDYQSSLRKAAARKSFVKRFTKSDALILVLFVVMYAIIAFFGRKTDTNISREKVINKNDAQILLKHANFANLKRKSFTVFSSGRRYRVDTSLDIPLQNYLLKKIDTLTSRYVGIVGMNPDAGKILFMVGFDKTNRSNNPCVDNRFPAASIFKIVTASAAVEKCGFRAGSTLTFNGMKHTLYKSQLKDHKNRYTNSITFRDSFAQSVNPVFGKIGALYLGKATLEKYAAAFGFNRRIDFEIQLAPSAVSFSDEPYHWAEIACGFNRETTLSPLHGALIAASTLNQGRLIEPTIIEQITDDKNEIVYRSRHVTINQAITPQASQVIRRLMRTTVSSGTCRQAFKGYKNDHILSKLNIGGKTGSIYNKSHDTRYDWFVGFAEEKNGQKKIAVSIVVAHEKYIGPRASYYAKIAMKQYFRNYFAGI